MDTDKRFAELCTQAEQKLNEADALMASLAEMDPASFMVSEELVRSELEDARCSCFRVDKELAVNKPPALQVARMRVF